jgi:hypothetical protein
MISIITFVYNFGLVSISLRNNLYCAEIYIIHIIILYLFFDSRTSSSFHYNMFLTPEFFLFNRTDEYEGITPAFIYKV